MSSGDRDPDERLESMAPLATDLKTCEEAGSVEELTNCNDDFRGDGSMGLVGRVVACACGRIRVDNLIGAKAVKRKDQQ